MTENSPLTLYNSSTARQEEGNRYGINAPRCRRISSAEKSQKFVRGSGRRRIADEKGGGNEERVRTGQNENHDRRNWRNRRQRKKRKQSFISTVSMCVLAPTTNANIGAVLRSCPLNCILSTIYCSRQFSHFGQRNTIRKKQEKRQLV